MPRRLCGKLHDGRSHLFFALHQSSLSIASYSSTIAACAHSTCIRRPRQGDPRRNTAMTFGTDKLWLHDGKNREDMFIRIDRMHERDSRTDTA